MALTWGLVVATYGRGKLLEECVRLAVAQTRPPAEVVIVDASPDWEATRRAVEAIARPRGVAVRYVEAERASSAAQRNQGIALAGADVLFLVDDDTLLYPDCAERILRVYEADTERSIVGVGGVHVDEPPPAADPSYRAAPGPWRAGGSLRARTESLAWRWSQRGSGFFLPYDRAFPRHRLPPTCRDLPIAPALVLDGFRMTLRRDVLAHERFEEMLSRYAVSEDQDLSYRVSRHGMLVEARDALLTHLSFGGGRLSRRTVAVLRTTNRLALNVLHSPYRARTTARYAAAVPLHVVTGLALDVLRGDWSLPDTAGALAAIPPALRLLAMTPARVRAWYPAFQSRVLDAASRPARSPLHTQPAGLAGCPEAPRGRGPT